MTTEIASRVLSKNFLEFYVCFFKPLPCFFFCPIYNGQMLEENKDIKDLSLDQDFILKDSQSSISYNKLNKLIIALYMVTDIMDKEEPLRNRLRTLGVEIISDTNSIPIQVKGKITEIMSFLDIASAVNLISEMNCAILKKEFLELEQSVREYRQIKSTWLKEFLPKHSKQQSPLSARQSHSGGERLASSSRAGIGHSQSLRTEQERTRIGVQKGSTLMKALSKVEVPDKISTNNFDRLKKQRREDITAIIKTSEKGTTITDVRTKAQGLPMPAESLMSCSEKTLQRELVSMVKEGVIYKTGEKRWSRYFVK